MKMSREKAPQRSKAAASLKKRHNSSSPFTPFPALLFFPSFGPQPFSFTSREFSMLRGCQEIHSILPLARNDRKRPPRQCAFHLNSSIKLEI